MVKRKWYVVTVGRDIGVFPTWLEAAALVKGVPNAIFQSFSTRAEATHMFTEEQARGRTRIVDPHRDTTRAASQPQRAQNYSAPTPRPLPTTMHQAHHGRVPPTSSRNRANDGTPSPIFLSDRRGPIVSNSSPSSPTSSPSSGLDISPSMLRLQIIQAALNQDSVSSPVQSTRSHDQIPSTPLFSNAADTSNFRSLTARAGPSSSSTTRPLTRAATASPDIFRSPKTYSPILSSGSASRTRKSTSAAVGFEVRAPSAGSGYLSHTNPNPYIRANMTTGSARTSNPTAEASSSSHGFPRVFSRTPDIFHSGSRLTASDSPGRAYASPRAVIRTPEWLAPYPTTRTPSPDSDSSSRTRTSSPVPSDELLSPLTNVNLNSFSLDNHSHRGSSNAGQRQSSTSSVNTTSTMYSTARRPSPPSQSPLVVSDVAPHQSHFTSTSTGNFSRPSHLEAESRPIEISHHSDPRSPILSQRQVSELAYESLFENSGARPSPKSNGGPLTNSLLSNFSATVNGHGSSVLFRH